MGSNTSRISDIKGISSARNKAARTISNDSWRTRRLLLTALLLFSLSGCGLTSGSTSQGPGGLAILTSGLSAAKLQASYSASLSASGGKQPYTWSIASGKLPTGLSLAASNGSISGTPTQSGNFSFTAKVVDSSSPLQTASQALNITVSTTTLTNTLVITTNSLPGAQVSVAYTTTLAAANGQQPYTWSMASGSASLPPGLALSASSGTISGTPTSSNAYIFTVQVTDSSSTQQTATHTYTMTTIGRTLDQYGGRTDIKCATITPYFHLEKINNKWFFCDPLGNGYISMSVGGTVPNGNPTPDCSGANVYPIYIAKYGDASFNWGWQTLKRMVSWGFNSTGQDSIGEVQPNMTCTNCVWPGGVQPIPVPYLTELKPAENAWVNRYGYLAEPIKDEMSGMNSNYSGWRGAAVLDVFDPKLSTELAQELQASGSSNIRSNDPYLLGVFTDDSDYFFGSGAGPDFVNSGHVNANIGWMTLATSPVQTYIQNTPFGGNAFVYQTTQIYSKTQATNPTTSCSISNPCSLRDYLWQKYNGNIASLNVAWGSNYTTFDSTGHQVTNEVIGTGTGSTTTFTHTLGHASVSPFSVLISVGGTPQIGDCPWFDLRCPTPAPPSNTGTLGSPTANYVTQASSTINYSTGAISITFVAPPASGATIAVNYVYGGWMAAGTGLMDEDASHSWVGSNFWCLEGPDPNYPTYFSCTGAAGANPVPKANPALGADLDNWIPEFAAQYFKVMHNDVKAVSNIPYLGLDIIGSWNAPAYSKFLQGASPYLDGAYVQLLGDQPSVAEAQAMYSYLTRYLGDVPLLNFLNLVSQPDSAESCNTLPSNTQWGYFPSQPTRGQDYLTTIQTFLSTTPSFNNDFPWVGFSWWNWRDFQNTNQGLVSVHDNAYDGVEAMSGVVPCESNYSVLTGATCGGESANYGDVITPVRNANLYWILH